MTETSLLEYDRIVVFCRIDSRFAWQYVSAGNSEIMGTDGGQGYESVDDCLAGALRVSNAPTEGDGVPLQVGDKSYYLPERPHTSEFYGQPRPGAVVGIYPIRIPSA